VCSEQLALLEEVSEEFESANSLAQKMEGKLKSAKEEAKN
jgi:hypothetical protein